MTISRKIGLHIIDSTGLALGRPTAVKLVDPSLETYRRVRAEVGAECLIVVRWYHAEQPLDNPVVNARDWFNAHRDFLLAVPGTDNMVAEGWNEIGDAQAVAHCQFEITRLTLLHAIGRRACVLNASVGTPDLPVWTAYRPMLLAMRDTDVLGLHEYWSDRADIENVWHVRRFTLPAVAANLQGKQIVVTECGRDIVEGRGKPGWMLTCSADEYLGDLRRLGELYDGCPNVIGATVFQTGSADPQWGPFNVWSVWPRVVSEYGGAVTPPIQPPPAPEEPTMRLYMPIRDADIVRITQRFNPPAHYGIDFSCVVGKPIYAAIDGVAYRGDQGNKGFGRYVRIEGTGGLYVYTAHLSTWAVSDGDRVRAGDQVGWSGNTGNSTGPHLHFEVRRGSRLQASAIDPEPLIVWPEAEVPEPSPQPQPYLPINDPLTLAAKTEKERYTKIRWWLEQADRQEQDHMPEYARAIRLALVKQLYEWERGA